MLPLEECPDADQLPRPLSMRGRPRSRSLGAPKVGPWYGLTSPRRRNPGVKEVHGEAEPVQREDGRQRTRARKTSPAQAEAPTGAHIERKAREMSAVFVLDAERRPLAPVHPGRARLLLPRDAQRADVAEEAGHFLLASTKLTGMIQQHIFASQDVPERFKCQILSFVRIQ